MLAAPLTFAFDSAPAFEDPVQQARYERLAQELRCLVCQNQTIGDSNAELAVDLRRELKGLMASGKTDAEIMKYMTDRYGDFVLFRPPVKPLTWLLWGAPGILLLIGLGSAAVIITKKARVVDSEPDEAEVGNT
jgi:cytochrome c-type biogenesis protein CcmH